MDPTALPTDNLYKFLALAGLMLAGFCGWLIWKMRDAHASDVAGVLAELAQLHAQSQVVASTLTLLETEAGQFHAGATEATNAETNRFYADLLKAVSGKVDRNADRQNAISVAVAAAVARREALDARHARHLRVARLLAAGICVGVAVGAFGFVLWYYKAQWYTDRQTKADFEDHMAELAAKRAARAKVKP